MDTGADTAPSTLTSTADLVGRRAVRAVFVAFPSAVGAVVHGPVIHPGVIMPRRRLGEG